VGIEIGIPMELNFYVTDLGFEGAAAIGGSLAAAYWLLMMIGRACSSAISGKVSTKLQLSIVSSVAIILLLIAIFMPESVTFAISGHDVPAKSILIAACGLCTSIMWGGIFNLSVEGLGKYTEAASGIFMTMVVGGGIMPLIQEAIAKSAGPIVSYWLVIAMLAYILFYALIGCKNVNTDIKVD
jgi:FHS family L-fucose permease-like MFS transporter